ncbi:MAG: FHA domain-containing protein [Acidobacteria bacterium]|nr:FHA domain-containing protein [Acidobacteriota bacterium]
MPAKLLVTNMASGREFHFDLVRPETHIGRAVENNDLILNDEKISRWHALLRRVGNTHLLIDLNSANGTFVNGKQIKEHLLADKDTISVGSYSLFYYQETISSIQVQDIKLGHTIVMRTPSEYMSSLSGPLVADLSALNTKDELLSELTTLKKKAETLVNIFELNKLLSSVFSLENIFEKLSEMIFRLTPADRFIVLLKHSFSDELQPFMSKFREEEDQQSGANISISKTVLDTVLKDRVSLLSSDAQADSRLAMAHSIILDRIHSIICAPLLSQDAVLGVIYLDCHNQLQLLEAADMELLNALAATVSMAIDNATTHKQLVKEALARETYGRFMPEHVVNEILANPGAFSLGGTNQEVTVLFSDIRGFTSIAETMPPETLIQLLNKYFSSVTPLIFKHHGLLDKYMGDGMMALFGVPQPQDDAALNAVTAAVEMIRQVQRLNNDLKNDGLPEISIGIGINTGKATVGYIGSEQRTDYSAVGDAVNLAARLEKQAQASQIVISETTLKNMGSVYPVRFLDEREIKGKKDPVRLYEVIWQNLGLTSPLTK